MLIIFGKGITATLSLEMVILFLRSGFSVYPVLANQADEWIVPESLKQVTGRTPMSSSFSPAWTQKQNEFSLALVINPDKIFIKDFTSQSQADVVVKYALDNCKNFLFGLTQDCFDIGVPKVFDKQVMTYILPEAIEHVPKAMELLFAESIRFLLFRSKASNLTYKLKINNLSTSDTCSDHTREWINQLNNELLKRALILNDEVESDLIIDFDAHFINNARACEQRPTSSTFDLQAYASIETKLMVKFVDPEIPDVEIEPLVQSDFVVCKRVKLGCIQIYDANGMRLFPNVSGQLAESRLADYLIDRLQVITANDNL